jgi:4-hydroxy-tetrahydrodipicolinate synthase
VSARLRGVLAPVITPFRSDLSPDPGRFARHCRWLLEHGCDGLAVFGTNSEANSLAAEERTSLLEALLAAGVPAERLMPGTGCCSLPETVRLTAHAVSHGCAGVLTLPPFYYKDVSEDGLFRYFAELVERVGDRRLRVYLYNIPQVSQVPIGRGLMARLKHAYPDAIAGLKDSAGDFAHTRAVIDELGPRGFDVFSGSERFLLATLRAGGAGCITAGANVNPHGIAALRRAWDAPEAERLQASLDAVRGALQGQGAMIPALKAVVAHFAEDEAWAAVRPPLVALTEEQRASLMRALLACGFGMPGLPRAP